MTRSELFAVMVGGLSTVAGSIIAGLLAVGIELKFLIAASFMAAPGSLLMAKLILPEVDTPKESLAELEPIQDGPVNVIDAAASGAASGLKLAANVGAMVLAFVSLIALLNGFLGWFGDVTGVANLLAIDTLSMDYLLGKLFQPVTWLLGVPWDEAAIAGSFIGQKIVINEFVAYLEFAQVKETLSLNTQVIVTFALCGFANFSSIAILVGGIGGMAPSRRHEIAKLGLLAVTAATLANLMSATLAGFFMTLS
jgi:CNT family concentrative nucleoside transporter